MTVHQVKPEYTRIEVAIPHCIADAHYWQWQGELSVKAWRDKWTDWFTDELFGLEMEGDTVVKAKMSRLECDVERLEGETDRLCHFAELRVRTRAERVRDVDAIVRTCRRDDDCGIIALFCNTKDQAMTSMITARVDAKKRKAAERVFSEVGLTTSAAVNLFICAVAMHGGIPFAIGIHQKEISKTPVAQTRHTRGNGLTLGQFASKVKLPADFDEKFDALDAEVAELFL